MNNKLITVLVVAVVAALGFGAVKFTKNNNNGGNPNSAMHAEHKESAPNKESTQETDTVSYKDFAVSPKSIRIKKGTTVTWTNEDSAKHDVTPDQETDEFKASELFGKGQTYQAIFNKVGTFTYHCSPHPYMKGSVEVVE